jgi:hypothetical protein
MRNMNFWRAGYWLRILIVIVPMLLLLTIPAGAQQKYIGRYDIYTGYTFLNSPHISLFENGFHTQIGYNRKTWLAMGFDYSVTAGDMSLTPDLLPDALQQTLKGILGQLAAAGKLPPGYSLMVPAHSVTQTFAAGPQLMIRHFSKVTFFVRPSLGAIYEKATPKPGDAIATLIVQGLAPKGQKTDWQGFYGIGWGFDINVSKHVGLRLQADEVYDHLFNDILKDGRWTTRFSVGPTFHFGRNIAE